MFGTRILSVTLPPFVLASTNLHNELSNSQHGEIHINLQPYNPHGIAYIFEVGEHEFSKLEYI